MKILLCKGDINFFFCFMKFFDCLVKFWTLLYGPKAQWSNSQKANFIGFKQGQFWSPYMCTYNFAYFKSGCQVMRVRPPHQDRTVYCKICGHPWKFSKKYEGKNRVRQLSDTSSRSREKKGWGNFFPSLSFSLYFFPTLTQFFSFLYLLYFPRPTLCTFPNFFANLPLIHIRNFARRRSPG